MHRNSLSALVLVILAGLLISFSACDLGSGTRDLAGLTGVWDYDAWGTAHFTDYYSVEARRIKWSGVYSISPLKITDKQGYDWAWVYDDQTLQFELLKAIPLADTQCGVLLIEGTADFEIPMTWGSTNQTGYVDLSNADITCQGSGETGHVSGTFSVHMTKRT